MSTMRIMHFGMFHAQATVSSVTIVQQNAIDSLISNILRVKQIDLAVPQ